MIPKKTKTLIPEFAKEINIPEEVVSNIINGYWDEVSDTLRNIEHTNVYIEKFGEFRIKHWLLTKKILDYSEKIDRNPGITFLQKVKKEEATLVLEKMQYLQKQFAEAYSKKQTKKEERNEFTRSKKDMEQ